MILFAVINGFNRLLCLVVKGGAWWRCVEGGSTIALDVVAILELKNKKYGKW